MMNTARMWAGLVLIGFGILMLLDRMDIFSFREILRTYWPLILVGMGIWIIFGRRRGEGSGDGKGVGVAGDIATTNSSESVHESNVFGNVTVHVRSGNFKGGAVTTVFGNAIVDLTQAAVGAGEHRLKVECVFGKAEVVLPTSIVAKVNADTLLGSVTVNGEKREGFVPERLLTPDLYATAPSRLFIKASTVMGEVVVNTVPPR
jgi:hypothetical protein